MSKPLVGRRRSAVEILFEILSCCRDGGLNKTAIMYRCNLSYDQLVRYLSFTRSQNLLVRNQGGQFELTDRGQETFDQVDRVIRILLELQNDEGGESKHFDRHSASID